MNHPHNFKSLDNYIAGLINRIDYNELAPPFIAESFKSKIEFLLKEANAYWDVIQEEQTTWLSIKIKQHISHEPIVIRIFCSQERIKLLVLKIESPRFKEEYSKEISIVDAWIDQIGLYELFSNVLSAAIRYANRSNLDEKFPNSQ